MSFHRDQAAPLKPLSSRSAWPDGRLTSTDPGRVAIDASVRVVRLPFIETVADGARHRIDGAHVDVIVVGGVSFVRERGA